jgi:hypothetical protein
MVLAVGGPEQSLYRPTVRSYVEITLRVVSNTTELPEIDWYIGYDGVRLKSQNCGLYGPTVHPRVTATWTMV